ncbi:potassium transporter Kup [Seohaeicola saemankumensis]|uniref:Probable potassium transport system protein Kup n=1 Tax=Seohaeicola saemankumensis TaxID=481181 RepID=A0ABW3TH09_9RHOB
MTSFKTQGPFLRDESRLPVLDEDELDIADYLREEGDDPVTLPAKQTFAALTIGAVGVVYGDIGTSPLYAFREALRPVAAGGTVTPAEVLGLLSLLIWTLILIVTLKYVFFLLRVDNRGEGGILALYTMVRLAIGRRSIPVLSLAIIGAALFFGDAVITPAISVLSAVEGAGLVMPALDAWVVPATLGILAGLFAVQRRGTKTIARTFGPITVLWFSVLAGLGLWHILKAPEVLAAFNPVWAVAFLTGHQMVAFAVLGAVFLAVTGAEALYADLGHFGRRPIMVAWFALVFPALMLNYLGQGALVLTDPGALSNPLFAMVPPGALPWLVTLATAATVIAAQAVISGAFSMGRAAIQLGLLPRMMIRHTAADQSGQIYIGTINWLLLAGVVWLVLAFQTSEGLAHAYGIAVTGTMIVTSALACLYLVRSGLLPLPLALVIVAPIAAIEIVFLMSNLTKIMDGGFVPVVIALVLGAAMCAWWRGTQTILAKSHRLLVPIDGFARSMADSSVHIVPGTAFFLSPDPEVVPSALLHNLKHNRVLHEQTVILTIETLRVPLADPAERASFQVMGPHIARLTLRFGFMETPNVSRALGAARRAGLKFDVMRTTFFLGRRRPVVTGPVGWKRILDRVYALLYRMAADPSDFYHLPRDRVVELGERVAV